jgi:hypothetical protein
MEKLKVIFIVIPLPLASNPTGDEPWDLKKKILPLRHPRNSFTSISEIQDSLPCGANHFATFRDSDGVTAGLSMLEDQCQRLMGSLEESRLANEALTAERDHYKEFWNAMNNYHTVMSRF